MSKIVFLQVFGYNGPVLGILGRYWWIQVSANFINIYKRKEMTAATCDLSALEHPVWTLLVTASWQNIDGIRIERYSET